MGGRGEQARGKMEYPIAQRQKPKQRGQDVAVYGMLCIALRGGLFTRLLADAGSDRGNI